MEKNLERAKKELHNFYDAKREEDEEAKKQATSYLDWVTAKTRIIRDEKSFEIPDGTEIRRGMVFWTEFGYNIDQEFGGRHPSIVLRKGGKTAIVLPISTQQPTDEQKASGIYVPIENVYRFKPPKEQRWVNVLNSMPISIQRFDFSSTIGYVKGPTLDKIREGVERSALWSRGKQ